MDDKNEFHRSDMVNVDNKSQHLAELYVKATETTRAATGIDPAVDFQGAMAELARIELATSIVGGLQETLKNAILKGHQEVVLIDELSACAKRITASGRLSSCFLGPCSAGAPVTRDDLHSVGYEKLWDAIVETGAQPVIKSKNVPDRWDPDGHTIYYQLAADLRPLANKVK